MARTKTIEPIHPGEILKDELGERGISLNQLARDTRIPLSRVSLIANGRRSVTADTAMRFGRYFGTSAAMWMGLQSDYELRVAAANAEKIEREVIPAA
ncbi:MAG: HigA family addiction module antitoxin [Acidobacteriota bacterium]